MKGKRETARSPKNQDRSRTRARRDSEETTFLFLGNKVMDELRVLARLASPHKNGTSDH